MGIRLAEMNMDSIEQRYNPENDTAPGLPDVTWADMKNAEAILELVKIVIDLLNQDADLHSLHLWNQVR